MNRSHHGMFKSKTNVIYPVLVKSTIMGDNSKFLAGVIVGAAAGAAVTLLLNSENGKQVFADLKSAAEKAFRDWKDAATDAIDEAETAG